MTKAEHLRLVTWRLKILRHATDENRTGGTHLPLLRDLSQDLLQVETTL